MAAMDAAPASATRREISNEFALVVFAMAFALRESESLLQDGLGRQPHASVFAPGAGKLANALTCERRRSASTR